MSRDLLVLVEQSSEPVAPSRSLTPGQRLEVEVEVEVEVVQSDGSGAPSTASISAS